MYEKLVQDINNLYYLILQPIDNIYKKEALKKCKKNAENTDAISLSSIYYKLKGTNKEKGVVYTPQEIANFMIKNSIEAEDIIKNPYIKIIDPACGCGNLMIPCFIYLRQLFEENVEEINKSNDLNLNHLNIDSHIVNNNLFGFDIDEISLKVLIIDLFDLTGIISNKNFQLRDFLLEDIKIKFDIFIGNPPYIGHKSVDRDYSKLIKEKFKGIYKDKGDISYCFFKKAIENLSSQGKITFITSRYFLESPSGSELRKILKEDTSIYKIIDFYGIRPFKNTGIDPVIIFTEKGHKDNKIEVIKPLKNIGKQKHEFYNSLFLNNEEQYKKFFIHKNSLKNEGWALIDNKERAIIKKIEERCSKNLGDICDSYQGIITGCDRAFIVDENIILRENLERDIIKPWIKSSFIDKEEVLRKGTYIIYSNLIDKETKYKNSIRYIENYKERLLNRRECIRGTRKWFQLQWGRDYNIFEEEKIIFPYKSKNNKFALDKGSYFSADVYCLKLKENSEFNYNCLLTLLNSDLYEFYFKTFAKKLGESIFEYYPSNLMKLSIPSIDKIKSNIDISDIYKFFDLTQEEIEIIKKLI